MLARAARSAEPAPALALGTRLWAATALKDVRGAACPWRGLGVVGRGEQIFAWERRRSAPRTITVPNELTKECLWAGARRLTDRAQAAGDSPAGARVVDDSPCPPGHNTPLPLKRSPPASFKRLLDSGICSLGAEEPRMPTLNVRRRIDAHHLHMCRLRTRKGTNEKVGADLLVPEINRVAQILGHGREAREPVGPFLNAKDAFGAQAQDAVGWTAVSGRQDTTGLEARCHEMRVLMTRWLSLRRWSPSDAR